MILVRKNVYKVLIFWKNFQVWKLFFESVGVCFENSKDVFGFEVEQATRNNLPTYKSFVHFFLSFDIAILPLIGKKPYLSM